MPSDLASRIDEVLEEYLPYLEDENHPDWRFRYESNGIHCSVHVNKPMIRSVRKGTSHHPVEYLRTAWDLSKAVEYETNVDSQRLLKAYNPHTALVYKAYRPVWPTSPRDFASVAHWCLLERSQEEEGRSCQEETGREGKKEGSPEGS